jgi:DNA polymerase-3 subunit delta'
MLGGAFASERISHAYLFYGPEGSGKRAVAISLAAALVCRSSASGQSCPGCDACEKAIRLEHPDVHYLMPAPKDTGNDIIGARLRLLGENPYSIVDFDRKPASGKAASSERVIYSVDRIHHDVHRSLSFAAAQGGYKVVIMSDADRLNTQAANALLKVLEEPRPGTVLILVSSSPDALLPTIRSRCQAVRFDRLSDAEIATSLVQWESVEPGIAATFARMADGSYSQALDLVRNPELIDLRESVIRFMRTAYQCRSTDVVQFAEELQRSSREHTRFFYQLLLLWLRDILMVKMMGAQATIVNIDQAEAIAKFAGNLPDARVDVMVELVEEAGRLINRNVNARLNTIVLATRLAEAMRGMETSTMIASITD